MKDKFYYKDGSISDKLGDVFKLHREDGPAIEFADGYRAWYVNGRLHREDGPAIEDAERSSFWCSWYLNGKSLVTLTKEQLTKYMETYNLSIVHLLTDSDEMVRTSAAKYDWKEVV
jgi:hypothetical protein